MNEIKHKNLDCIALCLSGGGFRATFFHLGVLAAMRDAGILPKVIKIYSVSGGSITAAHFALNWTKAIGTKQDFVEVCSTLINFGKLGIRDRMLRRWLLATLLIAPRLFLGGRNSFFEREYRRLFGTKRFSDIYQSNPAAPDLEILSTSFTTGALCSFSRRGFSREVSARDRPTFHLTNIFPLAKAVAMSSAFPPLFPPILLTGKGVDQASQKVFAPEEDLLADGGVYDNLGAQKYLFEEARREFSAEILILSDAGAKFDWNLKTRFGWIFQRAVRASDIMMDQMSAWRTSRLRKLKRTRVAICSIASVSGAKIDNSMVGGRLDISIQQHLPFIRTDLDGFSDLEIDALMSHGYQVCRDELQQMGFNIALGDASLAELCSRQPQTGSGEDLSRDVANLRKGTTRRYRILEISDPRPTFIICALFLLAFLAAVVSPVILVRQQHIIQEQRKRLVDVDYNCDGESVFRKRDAGWVAINERDYARARSIASVLRECNGADPASFNILGSVAFLSSDFDGATAYFERAVQVQPNNDNLMINLADSLVELSLTASSPGMKMWRLERAIALYKDKRISNADIETDELNYKLAKAFLFATQFDKAEHHIKLVKRTFSRDDGRGKSLILLSAIHLSRYKEDPEGHREDASKAAASFSEGYKQQPAFWADVFVRGAKNPEDPYDGLVELLGADARKWIGTN